MARRSTSDREVLVVNDLESAAAVAGLLQQSIG
jgi:hypothetical protein